ncbi:hypothetical protein ACFWIR_36755, partial [Streptomyces olivaceus]
RAAAPRLWRGGGRGGGAVPGRPGLSGRRGGGRAQDWTLLAEAEEAWDLEWPSPATMFWPDDPDVTWDRDAATGLRLRGLNTLPDDDKAVRRLLKEAGRSPWNIHVVPTVFMRPTLAALPDI